MNLDIEKIKPQLAVLAQKHQLKLVVLFGTAAMGKLREDSDIDVAVLRVDHQPLSVVSFSDINRELEPVLGAGFRIIDLIDLFQANILLRYEIMTNGVLLYGSEEDYGAYRIFARKDYIDSQSLRDLEAVLIKKRQAILADKVHA